MAYRDDIIALGADHLWRFDGDSTDTIGSANGTDTGIGYGSGVLLCEDSAQSAETNAVGDRVALPSTTTINSTAQSQKTVAGWFRASAIQQPFARIYGEGDNSPSFQFVLGFGNIVTYEIASATTGTIQIYSDVALAAGRVYHLALVFDGNGGGNEVSAYLDGVKQLEGFPVDRQPDQATLTARGVADFGDPAGSPGLDQTSLLLVAPVNGRYSFWAAWGSDALTETQVRDELFEKGALPDVTITTGTQAAMQTQLDALASTVRSDAPLCIRVEPVTGDGNVTLTADNVTFDPLASIHVQYTGTGTLTWVNDNGGNASIGSTPTGGTVVFETPVPVTVTCIEQDGTPIQDVRVRAVDGGTVVLSALTDAAGQVTTTFGYVTDVAITGLARKGSSPSFQQAAVSGTITAAGFAQTVVMVPDE